MERAHNAVGAVTDKDWDEIVLKSSVPVLVDFWAPWCGPCRMIAPLIDEISAEYGDKIKCVRTAPTRKRPGMPSNGSTD